MTEKILTFTRTGEKICTVIANRDGSTTIKFPKLEILVKDNKIVRYKEDDS